MNPPKKILSDAEILEQLLNALYTNKKKFAKDLGYKSHQSIYFVANGTNRISEDMFNRIILKIPDVNPIFLRTGKGSPLKYKKEDFLEIMERVENLLEITERVENLAEKLEELVKKLNSTS